MKNPGLQTDPFKGITSPCSECQNYYTDPASGFPPCPRRLWKAQKDRFDQQGDVTEPPDYLLASGTDSDDTYANPVYFEEGQTILIWVAPVRDNRVSLAPDGTIATVGILDRDNFDTRYTRCQSLPFVPEESWSDLLVKGAYKEWDQILVTPVRETQEEQDSGSATDLQPVVQFGGFAKKVNFPFFATQTSPTSDRLRSGT